MRRVIQLLEQLLLVSGALPLRLLSAQPAQPPVRQTVELVSRARWMNERQVPLHTPHVMTTTWISIDSVVPESAAAARVLWGKAGERNATADPMTLVVSRDGHWREATLQRRTPPSLAMMRTARDSARSLRFGVLDSRATYLSLPAARTWDLVPVFRPARLAAGERWRDTIEYSASFLDMRSSLRGIRTYTLERDTSIGGRQYWIVRDTATVTLTERFSFDERRLDSLATIEREVRGRIVGKTVVDPATGLMHRRADSADLRGDATLRYPDGRAFRSPTRFDRVQTWAAYDAAALARREAQLAADREANSFSIVRVARNPLEERLQAKDPHTFDSLYNAWTSSRDPDQRAAIKNLLRMWQRDSVSRARLQAALMAEGDTVYLVENADPSGRITRSVAALLIAFMRDPGLAFRHGVSRDIPYERPVEVLAFRPPALEPDSTKWACEPAACRLLAAEWRTATEPRLRSVALAVLTLMDPRRWRDTFLVRARAGANVLQLAMPVVDGAARSGLATLATPNPAPPRGATWEAWRDWVRGPAAPAPPVPPPSGRGALPPPPPRWILSAGNSDHLKFLQVATGRDIAQELRDLSASAPSDTAFVVINNILAGMDALAVDVDSVVALATHTNPLFRAFANRLVIGTAPGTRAIAKYAPADSATNVLIHRQLLAALASKREPWPSIEQRMYGGGGAGPFREPPSDAPGAAHPTYYDMDSVDVTVRSEFAGRLSMMSGNDWSARSSREGGELWSISRVEHAGPIVRVSVQVAGRIARAANQGPQAWYSWTTYFLVERNGEWLLLAKASAVT